MLKNLILLVGIIILLLSSNCAIQLFPEKKIRIFQPTPTVTPTPTIFIDNNTPTATPG